MSYEFSFTASNKKEVVDALKEIFLTPLGEEYKHKYYTKDRGDEDLERILSGAQTIAGGPNITVSAMTKALRLLIDSGDIRPKDFAPSTHLEEPVEDLRPRDKNGKLLTESQRQWSEYRQFAETASMEEVNRRKRTDPGFASFVRKNYEREAAQEVGDAVVPVGQSDARQTSKQISGALVDFANAYRTEPSQNLIPKGGFVSLAGRRIPYSQFIEQVNAATAAGIL
jgi:hypothetical protein